MRIFPSISTYTAEIHRKKLKAVTETVTNFFQPFFQSIRKELENIFGDKALSVLLVVETFMEN